MTKYKLTNGTTSIDFPDLEAVAVFKLANPEWAGIEAVAYNEEPQPETIQVPDQVTLWQFKQACAEKESPLPGFASLEKLIDYLIGLMDEGVPKQRALRAWTIANQIARSSGTIEQLRGVVNQVAGAEIMPVAYVDNLFIQANQIDA